MHAVRATVRLLVASGLVLGLGIATGCGGDSDTGERVLVIGDSITVLSRDQISQELERDGWQPTIEAENGTDVAHWVTRARDLARVVKPRIAVVELGTNQRGDEAAVGSAIDQVMLGLRKVPTVLWLNVQEHKISPPQPSAVNAVLDDATSRWDNLEILDFDDYFAGKRRWLSPDGLHPSDAGRLAIARFLRAALRDVGTPTTTSPSRT